ncbi:hypothetical protein AMS68_000069 [Peltaster fructicola]|uniref:Methyltransferase domain-containing protein n=1 Tax=Peltaster fructicola TaxID=286661 RepID=A0A6H0XIL1_9PEZI|nr:hypothetical protein AMS68_000069 [Peltaster fructicola]
MADLTQANKNAFDEFAATYDLDPWQLQLSSMLATYLQQNKDWIGAQWTSAKDPRPVKLLDYACGTGAASVALKPFVTTITGLDISEGMVDRYNIAMSKLGYTPQEAHGAVADITNSDYDHLPEVNEHYDVAIISLALHHVPEPELLLKALAKRLKLATGVLIVVDFLPFEHAHKGHKHKMAHTVKQHGFNERQTADLYKLAGFEDFGFIVVPERVKIGEEEKGAVSHRDMFIARGRLV